MKAYWRIVLGTLFVLSGMHVMAAPSDRLVVDASSAVVTLDLYSGRPNPAWSLSGVTTTELLRRLRTLEASKVDTPEFDGLGYRAVHAELKDQGKSAAVVSAAHGVVTVKQAGNQFRLSDMGRQFELWLVNTGTGHVPSDILQFVAGEIAKSR